MYCLRSLSLSSGFHFHFKWTDSTNNWKHHCRSYVVWTLHWGAKYGLGGIRSKHPAVLSLVYGYQPSLKLPPLFGPKEMEASFPSAMSVTRHYHKAWRTTRRVLLRTVETYKGYAKDVLWLPAIPWEKQCGCPKQIYLCE